MKLERYELKYRIPLDLEAPIREHVARYCAIDPAAQAGRYRIASLYLDTPDLRLYRETLDRQARRFKLRIRRYDGPAHYVEIKHRIKDVIAKQRVRVPDGQWPACWHDPRLAVDHPTWHGFVARALRWGVQPTAVVRYEREAWAGVAEEYSRVTFDHHLTVSRPTGWAVPIDGHFEPMDLPHRFGLGPESGVVLELKALKSVPLWMRDLIRRFGLGRSGFSKYGAAVETLSVDRLRWAPRTLPRSSA